MRLLYQDTSSASVDAVMHKHWYLLVPLAKVIGQQLESLALADQHLLGNELEEGVVIAVGCPVFFHLV